MKKFIFIMLLHPLLTAKIVVWREDLFPSVAASLERTVYRAIKESVIPDHVDYLLAAWPAIIRDNLFEELQKSNLALNRGFAVCGHEGYRKLLPPLKEIGITVLFTPYVTVGEMYDGIDLVPFPLNTPLAVKPAGQKDIYYSFIGCISNPIRKVIINEVDHPLNCIIKVRSSFHWNIGIDPDIRRKRAEEYKEVLSRSRFSLCPRGNSGNSFRLWESLSAGAIPVVLADDIRLPLDDIIDWSSAIIQISEKDVKDIPKILQKISVEQEKNRRKKCLEIAHFFQGSGVLIPIAHYYGLSLE